MEPDPVPTESTVTVPQPLPAAQSRFAPGDVLEDRFRIVREVGRGGMGTVYEAFDEKLRRRIALKCAQPSFGPYLRPEVRNASEISHRNICRVYEIHIATTRIGPVEFLTMEFVDGETLSHRLRRGPLPRDECLDIARQLTAGLAEAHRNRIVHGDIKTNNVILSRDAGGGVRAVITDFGLAGGPETQLRHGCGTPGYMAPEVVQGGPTTTASDVFAVGAVLSAMREITSVDPRWDRILARCLDPDPRNRYADAGELAQALAPSRARRRIAIGVAGLALAAATGMFTYRTATAPADTIRLAILPFSVHGQLPKVDGMGERIAARLTGARRQFTVFSPEVLKRRGVNSERDARVRLNATHALSVTLNATGTHIRVDASLTELASGQQINGLRADYSAGEEPIIAGALTGTITGAFHTRPVQADSVSAAAYGVYMRGHDALLRDNQHPEAAIPLLEKAIALDPSSTLPIAELANAQVDAFLFGGDPQWLVRAADSVSRARSINADSEPVLLACGLLDEQNGRHEAAVRDFSRAIELSPTNGDAVRLLALAFEHSNRPADAVVTYERSIAVDPGNYRTYIDFGNFLYFRSDFSGAEQNYRRAIGAAPALASGHMNLGLALMQQRRFAEAESAMLAAIARSSSADALMNLGAVYYAERKFPEAATAFESSVNSGVPTPVRYKDLGDALRQLGRRQEAASAYRKAFQLAEQETVRNPRQGFMRAILGQLAARLGDAVRAQVEIEQALALEPENAAVVRESIITCEVLGRRPRALALLADASPTILRELAGNPDVRELQGDVRFRELLTAVDRR